MNQKVSNLKSLAILSTESIYQDVRRMESMISKTDSKAVSIKEDNEEIRAKEQIAHKYNVENENKRYITYSFFNSYLCSFTKTVTVVNPVKCENVV